MCSVFCLLFFFSCLSLSLSLSRSQSLTDAWVRNHSNIVVLSELGRISLHVCAYVCHVCFDLMRSLLLHPFAVLFSSLCASALPMPLSFFSSVDNVVARSSLLFVLLSLVCSRTVIIVVRKICKFDDRLGGVQPYYRLDICMADKNERGRPSLGLFRFISKRRWIVAFITEMCYVYVRVFASILLCCRRCCRHFFDSFLAL